MLDMLECESVGSGSAETAISIDGRATNGPRAKRERATVPALALSLLSDRLSRNYALDRITRLYACQVRTYRACERGFHCPSTEKVCYTQRERQKLEELESEGANPPRVRTGVYSLFVPSRRCTSRRKGENQGIYFLLNPWHHPRYLILNSSHSPFYFYQGK